MIKAVFALSFLLISPFLLARQSSQTFNRSAFYAAMSANKLDLINAQEELLSRTNVSKKEGFEGALLMRKAGLLTKTQEKLSVFKEGNRKLESAISRDGNNAELRFLRLMIQENAPRVVKYRNNIDADSQYLKANFKQMPAEAQYALLEYAKVSAVLDPSDF